MSNLFILICFDGGGTFMKHFKGGAL